MQLISINTGEARELKDAKKSEITGIFKTPAHQPTLIHRLGVAGDTVCDVENHGGPDQAVYVYGTADYDWWAGELGQPLSPGTFGENLTISGLESAKLSVGDRLQIGPVILEITAPRIPCGTLARRMGEPAFAKRFRFAGRPGLYCRVIQEGTLEPGLLVTLEPYSGETVTIDEMFHDYYDPHPSEETLRRYLKAPIAVRARVDYEEKLQALLAK